MSKDQPKRDQIVTMCGSTSFKSEIRQVSEKLRKKGVIVLDLVLYSHADYTPEQVELITDRLESALGEIQKMKIDASDAIVVVNPEGYVGQHTQDDIDYATKQKKMVYYYGVSSDLDCPKCHGEGTIRKTSSIVDWVGAHGEEITKESSWHEKCTDCSGSG